MRLPRPVNRESFLAGLQRLRLPLIFWACDRTISYQYTLSYIRSLPPTSETGKIAAVDAIATALRLPNIFDFDPLFKLDAVVAVNDHELFSLLHIFLNEGLSQFKTWEGKHANAFQKYSESGFD